MELKYFIDKLMWFEGTVRVHGWAYCPEVPIRRMAVQRPGMMAPEFLSGYGKRSPDVAQHLGSDAAARCRFETSFQAPYTEIPDLTLIFLGASGEQLRVDKLPEVVNGRLSADPYHQLQAKFFHEVNQEHALGRVLELGSRARSGVSRRHLIATPHYVGFDLLAGENVDVVGDAHELSAYFGSEPFDAVFSMSVFEHLLMPWKVALELNQVMKVGAKLMITTHQTYPMHDTPWDFWRYSDQSWRALFNRATGFEVLATGLGERASIVPHLAHPTVNGMQGSRAFLGSAMLAVKIGESSLRWDVQMKELLDSQYPG